MCAAGMYFHYILSKFAAALAQVKQLFLCNNLLRGQSNARLFPSLTA